MLYYLKLFLSSLAQAKADSLLFFFLSFFGFS
jgi:hypothetical protein